MKCRWNHCKHGGEVSKEEAVKIGNAYYHQDCYNEKTMIQKIINLYIDRIDPNPSMKILRKSINDVIYKDGNSADFLYFALKYCLDNGWIINHPFGLKNVSKNNRAKEKWNEVSNIQSQHDFVISEDTDFDVVQITNINKPKGFASILGK